MAEASATPPAQGGIDQNAINSAVAAAIAAALPSIGTAIAEANKPVLEQLGKLQSPATPAADAKASDASGGAKALTLDDVKNLLAEDRKAQQQTAQQTEARKGFVADKLKDLPAVYQNQLGSDPAKWAAEEQQIRNQYQADFKATGAKPADVGGDAQTGKKPGEVVDYSKMTPHQLAVQGLKDSKPVGPGAAAPAQPAAAAAS